MVLARDLTSSVGGELLDRAGVRSDVAELTNPRHFIVPLSKKGYQTSCRERMTHTPSPSCEYCHLVIQLRRQMLDRATMASHGDGSNTVLM
jgi:hypothetical protein